MSELQTITHDVIVVGAGGAGLRAAIECSRQGLDTGVVCKSLLGKAHTVMAEGGAAAALGNADSRDNWKVHFRDTMRGGKFLNQWRMAELHAKEAPERIRELEEWGAVFDRTADGRINQRNFGGHRFPRLAHVGDRTGLELIRTLQDKGVHSGISVHMECTGLGLMMDGGRVAGMVGYWRETGRFVVFRAKAVIFATGGFGKAWKITSNSWEYTGDGQRMAYDVGAELMDMEFTQFHPTGMVWPPSVAGVLVTEGVRGEGGILRNKDGKRFMFEYIPEKFAAETADTEEEALRWLQGDRDARRPPELLTRDEVARSIYNEVKMGRGSPHGGAFLDISHRPADYVKKKLPSMYHQFKELAEVDITKEPMEVGPTFHYAMGGLAVDHDSQMCPKVPGLFACGEVAAGLHGANRLGGNSLSDLLVFGRRAGMGAKEFIDANPGLPKVDEARVKQLIDQAKEPLMRPDGENPYVLHDDLRESMTRNVGIWRDAEGMSQGIADIAKFRERLKNVKAHGTSQYNPGWSEAIDLHSMFVAAEATARSGLMREESRGAHSREDFQGERKEWIKYNIVCFKGDDGEMVVQKVERQSGPAELEKIANASIEDVEAGRV
ncbi:MAG: fumarate reductase/succinate dehydrogenase flavoprotein subunit [Alphaproteobacteria bacterium]|nr:fumarate reductase/succinate dehydrogenase flavoprotein subunit [Alphaproteobacteria bacterium]